MDLFQRQGGIVRACPLYPYQEEAVELTEAAWEEWKRVLIVIPTGGGKTMVAGEEIAREIEKRDGWVMMLAHTRKLVRQFRDSVETNYGLIGHLEMGEHKTDSHNRIVCATVQTMKSRLSKGRYKGRKPTLIVMDESHRGLSDSHQFVVKAFPDARVLGITATPRRGDHKDLMSFFEYKAVDIKLTELIEKGYLARLTIENIPITICLEKNDAIEEKETFKAAWGIDDPSEDNDVPDGYLDAFEEERANQSTESKKKKTRDYNNAEIAHAITPYLKSVADYMVDAVVGKCCLAFLPLIATSKEFTKLCVERGIRAKHVDGTMAENEVTSIITELELGEIDMVCNSMLLSEGVDIRPVNLILNLRPTESWVLYTQIAGRGTRTFDPTNVRHFSEAAKKRYRECGWGLKDDCILLDPLWQCERHSLLQRPATLVAETEEEAAEIDEILKKKKKKNAEGEEEDEELREYDLMLARQEAREAREEKLRKQLEASAKKKARKVNAMDFFLATKQLDLAEYEPQAAWEKQTMTAKQREFLAKQKFDLDSVKCFGHADKIIKAIIDRSKQDLATCKQAHYAKSLGMVDSWNRGFNEVSSFISTAAAGGDPYKDCPD